MFIEPQEDKWKKCVEIEKENLEIQNKEFFNPHETISYKNDLRSKCCFKGNYTNDNLSYHKCQDFIDEILVS